MQRTEDVLKILAEEIVPAEGCTEPIALAYAAALITKAFGGKVAKTMAVSLSGNMIKNVKSVHIPSAGDEVGIEMAVAMGALLGDSSKKFMVISDVDLSRLDETRAYAASGAISTRLEKDCPKLYIRIDAQDPAGRKAVVEISEFHTRVTRYELDGRDLLEGVAEACSEEQIKEEYTDRSFLNTDLICQTAESIDIEKIAPVFEKVVEYNEAIAREGLRGDWGIAIGKTIIEGIAEGVLGNDIKNNLAGWTAAGSDARMNGCPMPVMTTSGSGNQGMTCSIPVIRFCKMRGISHERMLRGLFVSHMMTVHIKENIGRLSAYCGAMAASAGVAGALAWLDGLGVDKVKMAVETTLATVSGIICDGAKSSCATKIASGIETAVDAYLAASKGRGLRSGDGIVGRNIESTIGRVGTLGSEGMRETDEVILNIMMEK